VPAVISENRKEFFKILGEYYKMFGYPYYYGWVEALLVVEPKKRTQKSISRRLSELFPSGSATSVPSVNRALKVLESYGVIKKEGSRKLGYTYELICGPGMIEGMFRQFIHTGQAFAATLAILREKVRPDEDPSLYKAAETYIEGVTLMTSLFEKILAEIGTKDIHLGDEPSRYGTPHEKNT
jgi:hypothetical protein